MRAVFARRAQWRDDLGMEKRLRVRHHIFRKLSQYYPQASQETLREQTLAFEGTVYWGATDRGQYLREIAEALTNAQRRVGAGSGAQQQQQAGVAGQVGPPASTEYLGSEDRQRFRDYVLAELTRNYPQASEQTLCEKAVLFERRVYEGSLNSPQYFTQIQLGLANAEQAIMSMQTTQQGQHPAAPSPSVVDVAAGQAGDTALNGAGSNAATAAEATASVDVPHGHGTQEH